MIQKVIYSSVKTAKNVVLHSKQTNLFYNPVEKEIIANKNAIKFGQIKRFFNELKTEVKSFFKKTTKNEELPKTNKVKKSNISYNAKTKEELEMERKRRVVVEMRARDAEEQIKKAGHSVSSGDIDQHGYLTSSGKHKVEHPTFKGLHDNLDFEETIRKELSHNDHCIGLDDVEHSYNDIIMRNHSTDIVEHEAEPSLMKALKNNQEQHLIDNEEHIADVANDYIDDLNEHLFG